MKRLRTVVFFLITASLILAACGVTPELKVGVIPKFKVVTKCPSGRPVLLLDPRLEVDLSRWTGLQEIGEVEYPMRLYIRTVWNMRDILGESHPEVHVGYHLHLIKEGVLYCINKIWDEDINPIQVDYRYPVFLLNPVSNPEEVYQEWLSQQ